MEHVPHPEKALEEVMRVLKPGGVAYLAPAWHCRPWAAEGYEVRPWSDFSWKGKLIKASIPLQNAFWFRAGYTLPVRIWREILFLIKGKRPLRFHYRALQANYETYWTADSDACNSMDPHEMLLWFQSRGWDTPSHPTWLSRFLVRHDAMIVQKPLALSDSVKEKADLQSLKPFRIAVLASHPIQYQAPLYRALAKNPEIDLTVLFCSDRGLETYRDEGFGQELKWDIPLLDGYRSEFLPNVSPMPNLSGFWGLINPAVIRRLRRGNFDAVWIHGWSRFTDWLAMLTAFASGIPVLLRGETNLLPSLPRWKRILKRAVLIRLFKKISGFLAIGRYNTEFYEAYGVPKEKIFHAPYAVDNGFFLSKAKELLPKKIELKKKLGIPEDLPVILFCGKLIPVKRPMDLLQAFAQVSKDTKYALVFVGDGSLRNDLEVYVREHGLQQVYFMGFQNQTVLPKCYAIADILVLPSEFEPWGLVVNEAMCFNLPMILSDKVGAAGDLLMEGSNGYTYPVGQLSELEKLLKLVLSHNDQRRQMGIASLQIINRWSYEENMNGVLMYFRKRFISLGSK